VLSAVAADAGKLTLTIAGRHYSLIIKLIRFFDAARSRKLNARFENNPEYPQHKLRSRKGDPVA
jgi:hypothetical protein